MQGIFRKENTDKALKYGIYRHLPTYEKIIRNLVSFFKKNIKWLPHGHSVRKIKQKTRVAGWIYTKATRAAKAIISQV